MNKKLKVSFIILNCIMATVIMALDIITCFFSTDLTYKYVASILVIILAITNFTLSILICKKRNFVFSLLLFLGVIVGCAGDITIETEFIIGGALFAVGHILYIVALYFISKYDWKEILVILGIVAISLVIVFVPYVEYYEYTILVVSYAVILSLMLAKCLSNFFFGSKKNLLNIFLAIAGILFYISDLVLLLYSFKGADLSFSKLCLMLYFPAQIIFASSLLVALITNNKKQ